MDQSFADIDGVIFLIGTASDPDGTIVSYLWEQTSGTMVLLASADDSVAAFTAPEVLADETLTFQLTVTDDDGATGHDTVFVTVTPPPSPGTISGTLRVGEGAVLDGDTRDEFDSIVENNSIQGQRIPINVPFTVAGHVDDLEDPVDVYHITVVDSTNIGLAIGDPGAADLDIFLADTNGTIITATFGNGRFESMGTGYIVSEEEFLVMVRAWTGASNYVLSFRTYDPMAFSQHSESDLRLDAELVPNEIIVEYREEFDDTQQDDLLASLEVAIAGDVGADVELAEIAVSPSGPILLEYQPTAVAELQLDSVSGDGGTESLRYATPEMAEKAEMLQAIKRLGSDPAVSYAEPNFINHALLVPNDTRYGEQEHYSLINLPAAWDITTGSDDVVIAVIDSGIRPHVDLWGRVFRREGFLNTPGNVVGYDFVHARRNPGDGDGIDPDPIEPAGLSPDQNFHGSHVAGTIGAETNNGQGVAGVTWQGELMPLRVLNGSGNGSNYDIAQAILYAAGLANNSRSLPFQSANIINLSLGPSNPDCKPMRPVGRALREAIELAINSGVHVVVAAGNNDCDVPVPMSTIDGVITVSAVDNNGEKASFSNYGPTIDVAAPGVGVLSTTSDDSDFPSVYSVYERYSGTSMAAPHVAGVLALMLSVNPNLTPRLVSWLIHGTFPVPGSRYPIGPITQDLGLPGRDDIYGYGLIDARKAVLAAHRTLRIGTKPGGQPILSASPDSLDFGDYRTESLIYVSNIGTGGELAIGSVTTDQ